MRIGFSLVAGVSLAAVACTTDAVPVVETDSEDGALAQTEQIEAPVGVAKITASLRDAMAANDPSMDHRVIVSLKQEALPGTLREAMGQPETLLQRQGILRATQEAFLSTLSDDIRDAMMTRYENIPAMSMRLNSGQIRLLERNQDVSSIEMMETYYKTEPEAHPLTGVDLSQNAGFLGAGVTVAVIDDGIQANHPAFGGQGGFPNAKIIGGRDFGDNDSDPRNDCSGQSHGTNVTGIIAGNGGGITGVAPQASIVFAKIQSSSICGQSALDGDLVGAIDWIISNRTNFGIDIINMSLGGGQFSSVSACESSSPSLTNVLDLAEASGIVTLASSGNSGLCQELGRPACLGSVISVGATYDADVGAPGFCVSPGACVATQSNPACSPSGLVAAFDTTTFADKVTVYSNSAPFLDILAPSNCAETSTTGSNTNDCFGGTSAASPFAAGVAALAVDAAGGSLNRNEVRAALRDNGDNITDGRNGRVTPRVNAINTVNALDTGGPTPENCGDGIDNDGDGDTDCADSDCTGAAQCAPTGGACLFSASFGSGSEGFVFVDDADTPAYSSGSAGGGSLGVTLGGVDGADITNILGSWNRDCTSSASTPVDITVVADLNQSGTYEADEVSEIRLVVNGTRTVLATIAGDGESGPDLGTGVQTYSISATLPAGTSTVALECFNNKKTFSNEVTDCTFNSVTVAAAAAGGSCSVEEGFENGATGWSNAAISTCSTGAYTLGSPTQQSSGGIITQVGGPASGANAVFTATNTSLGVNDVDGGECVLDSPTYSVSTASTLAVSYFHGQRDTGDDGNDFFALEVSLNGGSSYQTIASNGDTAQSAQWQTATAAIPAGSDVRLRLRCSDGAGAGDIVECGIDDIQICSN